MADINLAGDSSHWFISGRYCVWITIAVAVSSHNPKLFFVRALCRDSSLWFVSGRDCVWTTMLQYTRCENVNTLT